MRGGGTATLLHALVADAQEHGSVRTRTLGEVTVRSVVTGESGSARLRSDLSDDALVIAAVVVRAGDLFVSPTDDSREPERFGAGEAGYVLGWREYELAWQERAELFVIDAPEAVLRAMGVRVLDGGCRIIAPATLGPIVRFLDELLAPAETSPIAEYVLTQLVSEMTGALFLETFGVDHEEAGSDAALFLQADALIAARRGDPELTPVTLAESLRVSTRKLRHVFRDHGADVAVRIRDARVQLAVDLLRDESFAPLTVDDIARYAGFTGAPALRRALEAAGHASPSTLRPSAR